MRKVVKSLEVNLPVDQCFRFFKCVQCFPEFMKNVKSVQLIDPGKNTWHWVLINQHGDELDCDIRIDELVPQSQLTWHTLENSDIGTSGSLYFYAVEPGRTRIKLDMAYEHGFGLKQAFSDLFNHPETLIRENLDTYRKNAEAYSQTHTT